MWPFRRRNIGSIHWPRLRACPSPAPPRRSKLGSRHDCAPPPPSRSSQPVEVLGNLASISPGAELGTVSHYNVQPVIDIYANVDGTDLGSVTRNMETIIARHKNSDLPRGSHFILRGQSETMKKSYIGLLGGLAFSILLVYLLIVVNFQSWLDPFLIIAALPAALAGIVWFLFLTNTRLSVPALTGAIMCMGVATANSILVVTFARDQLEVLVGDARKAALNAGFVRLRPVIMTALAMIIGMVPMALGLGDGGEQNAPLGRAVIGGLLLATVATLFFVPASFSVVHGWLEGRRKTAHGAQRGRNDSTSLTSFRSNLHDHESQSESSRNWIATVQPRTSTRDRARAETHLGHAWLLLGVAAGPPCWPSRSAVSASSAARTTTACWPTRTNAAWPLPR